MTLPVVIHLLHGRTDPEQDMEDWGFDGPVLGPFEAVCFTYKEHIRCIPFDPTADEIELNYLDDMLVYDGNFYGDFHICASHAACSVEVDANQLAFL